LGREAQPEARGFRGLNRYHCVACVHPFSFASFVHVCSLSHAFCSFCNFCAMCSVRMHLQLSLGLVETLLQWIVAYFGLCCVHLQSAVHDRISFGIRRFSFLCNVFSVHASAVFIGTC
jgi:hypothetical protein